jgi:hypothetical protein
MIKFEYLNINIHSVKDIHQIGWQKFLQFQKFYRSGNLSAKGFFR